jgi:hypothetical protein
MLIKSIPMNFKNAVSTPWVPSKAIKAKASGIQPNCDATALQESKNDRSHFGLVNRKATIASKIPRVPPIRDVKTPS